MQQGLSPRATKAALALIAFLALLVVVVLTQRPVAPSDSNQFGRVPQRLPTPNGPANVATSSFLHSLDHFYQINPKTLKFYQSFTFHKYQLPAPQQYAVWLPDVHFEWVLKYENHVVPVFEEHVFAKPDCLVLDVGANDGVYTQMSAGAGCSVVAFEMQDGCLEFIAAASLMNDVKDQVRIVPRPAYFEETSITTLHTPGMDLHPSTIYSF